MPLGVDQAVVIERAGRLLFSNVVALAADPALAGQNKQSGWVNLAMAGRWEGHPSGAFEFSPEVFGQIKANFDKAKTPVKFDYEHQTMNGQSGPKPASGHIKQLDIRDNGQTLWGLVDWTPKAAELIRNGEYNFCSPVVAFNSIDKRTGQQHGAELLQCALTDDPFLDGQQPIQLSFTAVPMTPENPFQKPQPPAQMGGAPPAPPPAPGMQPSAAAPMGDTNATQGVPPVPPPPAQTQMAEPPKPPAPPDQGQADANAIVDLIGDGAGGDRASVLKALTDNLQEVVAIVQKALASNAASAPEKRSMSKQTATPEDEAAQAQRIAEIEAKKKDADIVALTASVAQLAATVTKLVEKDDSRDKAAKEAHVDALIKSGHVEQSGREDAIWMFSNAPERAAKVYAKQIVPMSTQAGHESRETATTTTAALEVDGKVNVHAMSKTQQVAFKSLVERYNGDEAKAWKMAQKTSAFQKGSVH